MSNIYTYLVTKFVTIQRVQKFTCENFKKFKKVKKFTFNFFGWLNSYLNLFIQKHIFDKLLTEFLRFNVSVIKLMYLLNNKGQVTA